jgi:hypothetical protein
MNPQPLSPPPADSKPYAAAGDGWPTLHEDAYHGLAGQIIRAIAPESEADPVGVLLSLLVATGNAIGNGPPFAVGTDSHKANLFACLVGDTAAGKGQSLGNALFALRKAAPGWAEESIGYGLSSGEGLVDAVKDDEGDWNPRVGPIGGSVSPKEVVVQPNAGGPAPVMTATTPRTTYPPAGTTTAASTPRPASRAGPRWP